MHWREGDVVKHIALPWHNRPKDPTRRKRSRRTTEIFTATHFHGITYMMLCYVVYNDWAY